VAQTCNISNVIQSIAFTVQNKFLSYTAHLHPVKYCACECFVCEHLQIWGTRGSISAVHDHSALNSPTSAKITLFRLMKSEVGPNIANLKDPSGHLVPVVKAIATSRQSLLALDYLHELHTDM